MEYIISILGFLFGALGSAFFVRRAYLHKMAKSEANLSDLQLRLHDKEIQISNSSLRIQEESNLRKQAEAIVVDEKIKYASIEATQRGLQTTLKENATVQLLKDKESNALIESLRSDKAQLTKELTVLREQEPLRIAEYDRKITSLNQAVQHQREAESRIVKEQQLAVELKIKLLKETWARHEIEVEDKMKLICQQESIDYVDKEKFPLTGKPDNSVKILDEYIIFDSKSPQGEDLSAFPNYIKSQAESAKKYAKQSGVKKDIFLVIPTNAISVIKETRLSMGDYVVHVITVDAVRPILIQLKKIEDYEFAEKLSPEDRDKITTVIGKMAHGMKRKIQIDHYMSNEFIAILMAAGSLPDDILKGAIEVESKFKLNAPIEKRAKKIDNDELAKEQAKLTGKIMGQEIHVGNELQSINSVPLTTRE